MGEPKSGDRVIGQIFAVILAVFVGIIALVIVGALVLGSALS